LHPTKPISSPVLRCRWTAERWCGLDDDGVRVREITIPRRDADLIPSYPTLRRSS
jgi:hypothetical protein